MDDRFSEYRVMWIFVLFDLPTETKKDRKEAAKFRKNLLSFGFTMFQFSTYIRHCASAENAQMHIRRIKSIIPEYGKIGILSLTDKQFGDMQLFVGAKRKDMPTPSPQLELF